MATEASLAEFIKPRRHVMTDIDFSVRCFAIGDTVFPKDSFASERVGADLAVLVNKYNYSRLEIPDLLPDQVEDWIIGQAIRRTYEDLAMQDLGEGN